jgi:hypothetical protein
MRKLAHYEALGVDAQEVLDEFMTDALELGVRSESDVVSVQVTDAGAEAIIAMRDRRGPAPRVRVSIVYWGHERGQQR